MTSKPIYTTRPITDTLPLDVYQNAARRTAIPHPSTQDALLYLGLGINGEAGEVAEMIKKIYFHGHDFNKEKILDELGDVLWYVAVMADELNITLSTIARHNIDKLAERYPEGFDSERSRNRIQPEPAEGQH